MRVEVDEVKRPPEFESGPPPWQGDVLPLTPRARGTNEPYDSRGILRMCAYGTSGTASVVDSWLVHAENAGFDGLHGKLRRDVASVVSPPEPIQPLGTDTHDSEQAQEAAKPQRSTNATPDSDSDVPPGYLDHWVYIAKNDEGRTLYVGITYHGIDRLKDHRYNGAEWTSATRTVEIEHFDTREEAAERERELIRELKPVYNIVHNEGRHRRPHRPRPFTGPMRKWWPTLVTADGLASQVGVSTETVRREIKLGRLPGAVTIQGRRYITTAEAATAWRDLGSPEPYLRQLAEDYMNGRA